MVYFLLVLTAGNPAGYRGGVVNIGFEDVLVLPAVLRVPSSLILHVATDAHLFWVFGSLFQKRCGAPLASCCGSGNVDLFRRSGVSSASCCGSGPLRHSGTGNINWVITFVDASWRATPPVVAGLSRADCGHHVPALAVTSGGRGVGFDVANSGTVGGFSRVLRRQHNSNF